MSLQEYVMLNAVGASNRLIGLSWSIRDRVVAKWDTLRSSQQQQQPQQQQPQQQQRDVILVLLSVGASIGTLLLAKTWWNNNRSRISGDSHDGNSNNNHGSSKRNGIINNNNDDDDVMFQNIRSSRSQLVSPSVWTNFEQAAGRIRNRTSLVHPLTNGDKLLLYGLYKHIVDGNAPNTMPPTRNWNILAEQAKYEAWVRMRDIPIEAAIDHYTYAVSHFCSQSSSSSSSNHRSGDDDATESMVDTVEHIHDANVRGMFAPATVSRPGIENGGIVEDDDPTGGGVNRNGIGGTTTMMEVQLLQAAGRNHIEQVRTILKGTTSQTPVHVNYTDESGQTALHLAADKGSIDIVQALLSAGANVNAADHDGISVLQAAVIAGHVATCELLLQSGANPDQPDHDGDTPRSCAGDDGDSKMMLLFSLEL
jgi:acyl-CoA-binding protein